MATPVVFNGVNYSVPAFGDVGYAQGPGNLSAYLIAIASGTFQTTGGLFSLTADANFGPNFGLVSIYYKSASANIALSGVLRLANTDFIAWRNFANSADLALGVNTSDQLTYNGLVISTSVTNGTVNPGAQFEIPYYAAAGNTISPAVNIHYNALGDFELMGGHMVVFDGATSGAVSMKAPATVTIPYTLTLPPNPGTASYFLQTNGVGVTTWAQVQTTAFREDYIVGTPSGTYTGSLTVFNLANPYGVGAHTLIVTLDGDVQTAGATADYIETNSTTVTFNFSTVAGQRVSFLFNAPVTSIGGTVNSGTAPRLAQYAASGTTISEIGSNASANGFKITGLGIATTSGDALTWGQAFTSGAHTFSPTTTGIVGTTTNDNAAAGIVGEYVQSVVGAANATGTGNYFDATSISLTAGDWDVTAMVGTWEPNGATWTEADTGISTTAGNSGVGLTAGLNLTTSNWASTATAIVGVHQSIPSYRLSLSATTTVYLKGRAVYSAGTPRMAGASLHARRVR